MQIIKNKVVLYLLTRYFTYGIQFLVSLIIAWRINPYYMGIYGTILLIQSYFIHINFGIPSSLNVLLIHNKDNFSVQNKYILNSIVLYTYLNLILVIVWLFLHFINNCVFGKYDFTIYLPLILCAAIVTYYNTIGITIIRVRGEINLMSILGSIPILLNFCTIWIFKEEKLVMALVVTNLISCIIIFLIYKFAHAFPRFDKSLIDIRYQKTILKKGFYLFLYNSCFYFILIALRTIISSNYSVKDFGYFTFAFTIANAVLLLLDSLNTIIFPKIIDVLSDVSIESQKRMLEKLRIGYISSSQLLIYAAMCVYPFFLLLFPDYQDSLASMNIISLAIIMNTNSYGYSTLLIAQNKEKFSSFASLVALIISIILGILLSNIVNVNFSLVVISVLIAYMLFSFLVSYKGNILLQYTSPMICSMKSLFSLKKSFPYTLALLISLLQFEYLIWIPLTTFIALNYKDMYILRDLVKKIILNPNIVDV